MLTELVQEAGLTENQAQAYVALSKQGAMSAGQLARHLSKDRSYMYSILDDLANKGLVSFHEEDRRLYHASDPVNLLEGVEEKKRKLETAIEKLQSAGPKARLPEPRMYKGKEGLKTFVRKLLKAEQFCTLGGGESQDLFETLRYDYPHYLEDMREENITGRLITTRETADRYREMYGELVAVKGVEKEPSEVNYTIFEDRLAMYTGGDEPYVILIDDASTAQSLQSYFDVLWQHI